MKKIVIISGSPRPKGNTYKVSLVLEEKLKKLGNYSFEYLSLKKTNLEYCKGCLNCMKKGEEYCPCKDDGLEIRDQLMAADGFIFMTPVYVHTVSALMKNFFDRFAYFCHQPHFLGKSALILVTTELSGVDETIKFMEFPLHTWGLNIADGIGVAYPSYKENPEYAEKCNKRIENGAIKFHHAMAFNTVDHSFKKYILFHLLKLKVTLHKDKLPFDYQYWKEKGWINKSFYTNDDHSVLKSFIARNLVKQKSKSVLKKAGVVMSR